jgi:sugar-specific transcriptional regulator TrmB
MIKEDALEALGLTGNDARVCTTLLTHGPQRVADLEKITGIHRRNLYDSLNRLGSRGFVDSFVRNDKQYFQITSPDVLEEALERKEESIKEFISEMKGIKREYKIPEVHILAGEKGVKMLLDDELRTGKPVYGIASSGFEKMVWEYLDRTPHKVTSAGFPTRLVYIESDVENREKALKHGIAEIRVVPDEYRSSVALELYGDTSCIILENMIIRIKDGEVTERFRMFFDSLWKIGRPARRQKTSK